MDSIEYYSSIAPSYETLYREEQLNKIKTAMGLVKPKRNWKILDIGAGTGLLEENLRGFDITSIEPSEMADFLAAKKLPRVKIERVKISQFKSDKLFDAVFCITVLQDIDEQERAKCIKASFRFCRSGGKIVFSVLNASKIDLGYLDPEVTVETANDKLYLFTKK